MAAAAAAVAAVRTRRHNRRSTGRGGHGVQLLCGNRRSVLREAHQRRGQHRHHYLRKCGHLRCLLLAHCRELPDHCALDAENLQRVRHVRLGGIPDHRTSCTRAAYPAPEHVVDHIDREGVVITQSEIVLFGDEPAEEQLRHVLDEAFAA
ncbi:hypothetical protein T492DRAFT_1059272 [Pavlovales sp. CCMP2436]|nr:hypothetical protein T492DRAFT_1059272 [Pavlovales sp. CCMP2436]